MATNKKKNNDSVKLGLILDFLKEIFSKKYVSFFNLIILGMCIFVPTYLINFYELPKINWEIYKLNEKINSNIIISNNLNSNVYSKRLENLESKYIDVMASKDTINFWLTLLLVLSPVILWYTVYHKNRIIELATKELKEIRFIKESAEEKIKEAEKKVNKTFLKIDEKINNKISEFEKEYKNKLKEIDKKWNNNITLIDEEWEKQRKINLLFSEWLDFLKQEWMYTNWIKKFKEVIKLDKNNWTAIYNIACWHALNNNLEDSIKNLNIIFWKKYFNILSRRNHFYSLDDDFKNIKDKKEFKAFVKKVKDKYWDK